LSVVCAKIVSSKLADPAPAPPTCRQNGYLSSRGGCPNPAIRWPTATTAPQQLAVSTHHARGREARAARAAARAAAPATRGAPAAAGHEGERVAAPGARVRARHPRRNGKKRSETLAAALVSNHSRGHGSVDRGIAAVVRAQCRDKNGRDTGKSQSNGPVREGGGSSIIWWQERP
jgi:hypothetical protein